MGWEADIALKRQESHGLDVEMLSKRAELNRAALLAHVVGLTVVGFYGTVGTSGGFGNGAWVGMLAGGIISIPWIAALLAVIWFFAGFFWDHVFAMCVVGPVAVIGSWWLLDGSDLIDAVAITATVDSIAFLLLISFARWRRSIGT